MAFVQRLKDAVSDISTSTGTGDILLAETPPIGCKTFGQAYGEGTNSPCCVTIRNEQNGEFETCLASYNNNTKTIVRGDVFSSSANDERVNFSAGNKKVFVAVPAEMFGAFRWKNFDAFSLATIRETAVNIAIPDTSLPANPQVTETILAGDVTEHENVVAYTCTFAITAQNLTGISNYSVQLTVNGNPVGSPQGMSGIAVDGYFTTCVRANIAIAQGDVVGIKIHRSSGSGSAVITWKHIAVYPYKIGCSQTELLGRCTHGGSLVFNGETTKLNVALSPRVAKGSLDDWQGVTFSINTQPSIFASNDVLFWVDNTATQSNAATLSGGQTKGSISLNSFPRYYQFLTINDVG